RIEENPLIDVRLGCEVTAVHEEDGHLAAVTVERDTRAARALLICIGGEPRTGWAVRKRRAHRRPRLHHHRPRPARPRRPTARLAPRSRRARPGDERARALRGGRRPPWIDQARRGRRRRGLDGGRARAPAPGGAAGRRLGPSRRLTPASAALGSRGWSGATRAGGL